MASTQAPWIPTPNRRFRVRALSMAGLRRSRKSLIRSACSWTICRWTSWKRPYSRKQSRRQGGAIPEADLLQLSREDAPARLELDADAEEEALDAVDVGGPLLLEGSQLAMQVAVVLVLNGGDADDREGSGFAQAVSNQEAQELVDIEAVGLGAAMAARHLDAGGIDDEAVKAHLLESAMDPKAVAAGLIAAVDGRRGIEAKTASWPVWISW